MRPDALRYSVTTREPGAMDVLTQGCDLRPRSTAFLARRPAPIITDGFEVLVQLVMAAITTEPSRSSHASPLMTGRAIGGVSASVVRVPPPPSFTQRE